MGRKSRDDSQVEYPEYRRHVSARWPRVAEPGRVTPNTVFLVVAAQQRCGAVVFSVFVCVVPRRPPSR